MKALLVDGLNLVRRIHAAVPRNGSRNETNQAEPAHIEGVLEASARSLRKALDRHAPSHGVVVFESQGRNWRHQLFPQYKQKRKPMPADLQTALPRFEQAFEEVGLHSIMVPGYEADDVIATIAVKIARRDGDVVILSTDRNYCQLLGPHIRVYDHFGQRDLDEAMIQQRFHVLPAQMPDLLALAGDSSLSIPGVRSVGIRTAARLIDEYHTLERVLDAADDIPGKLGATLYNSKEAARLGQRLFTLRTDVELGVNLNQLRYRGD